MSKGNISICYCITFKERFMGFMFQRELKKILCFPHCNSIHTFFMRVPIWVIITNKNHVILYQNIAKPWKIIWPVKHGYYTYEFSVSDKDKFDQYFQKYQKK